MIITLRNLMVFISGVYICTYVSCISVDVATSFLSTTSIVITVFCGVHSNFFFL